MADSLVARKCFLAVGELVGRLVVLVVGPADKLEELVGKPERVEVLADKLEQAEVLAGKLVELADKPEQVLVDKLARVAQHIAALAGTIVIAIEPASPTGSDLGTEVQPDTGEE